MPSPSRLGVAGSGGSWAPRGGSGGSSSAAGAAASMASFNAARSTRSYLARLPLFTRVVSVLIVALYVVDCLPLVDLRAWGSLVPSKLSFGTRGFSFLLLPFVYAVHSANGQSTVPTRSL